MKRFAANYLYLSGYGFLKQHVVEIDEEGKVIRVFPLKEESEAISWMSGVIGILLDTGKLVCAKETLHTSLGLSKSVLEGIPAEFRNEMLLHHSDAVLIYPFDFERMEPFPQSAYKLLK